MKVDRSRLKKSTSEVPMECQNLIDKLRSCSREELLDELVQIDTWTFGKCELYHWIDVLDVFDQILQEAAETIPNNRWALVCDTRLNDSEKRLVLWTLHFTTLLIEHSFSRHLYNSMEHLNALLASSDMKIVLGVLNLLYMFSKRSNFITRLNSDKRQILLSRLHYLAESWGGKENGFGLADCCLKDKPIPASATTLHFEFYCDNQDAAARNGKQPINYIHVENVDKMRQSPAEIMRGLISMYNIPPEKEMLLFTHVRLASRFSNYESRLHCVQARLQALSVLVYSNALQDNAHMLLYPGILDELVELLELQDPELVDIRSAALRTLTSIIHLDRNPHFPKKPGSRLNMIIDVTGASLYHGFLPVLVRSCISTLIQARAAPKRATPTEDETGTNTNSSEMTMQQDNVAMESTSGSLNALDAPLPKDKLLNDFPLPLATALFSFLYHLASYEAGGDALVNCGMMESLLHVINWHGNELEHITVSFNNIKLGNMESESLSCLQFVTRAVRVIDLITNIDMHSFQNHGGLNSFIGRLNVEVIICRKEQPFEIIVKSTNGEDVISVTDSDEDIQLNIEYNTLGRTGKSCLPQRAALLKSMLNFLKKALQDPAFSDSIRHVMEGTLPSSLKHIISNAEYYGPSLFLLATDVVTVYVFQEPSLLSSLQDNGLTDVVLHALLIKEVPATREVLGSLPNVFSALCLNARGLASFVKCKPFERLFKVLLSPNYLPAMRRRRSSDPLGDTASNLGNAMDELMRHQPSLKVDATAAIIKLLQELCQLGTDTRYVCQRAQSKNEVATVPVPRAPGANEAGSSDEDDEDEEESTSSHTNRDESTPETSASTSTLSEKTPIVLVDYILNVMKFVDAILSNNSTDDHCREFVNQGGLVPLLQILALPNLPVDCPVTTAAQAVASVCKSILSLAHEPKVLKQGLTQLSDVLQSLKPLCSNINKPGGSILLHELANAPTLETAFSNPSATPLLHAMNAAHGYVLMFVHVCRTGQSDIRSLSLQHWGSEEGMQVLNILADLYTSLVWESTLLLALCSDDIIPANCDFGKEDMDRLVVQDRLEAESSTDVQSSGMTTAMQALSTEPGPMSMDVDQYTSSTIKHKDERTTPTTQQLKYIRPLLGASSRLGRALAELFGLLVKLCVGTPIRQRRGQNIVTTPPYPGPFARSVATSLNCLLASGLNWEKLPPSPIPKFRLTFLICSVGFTSPMLFDEKRYPYHLMLQRFVSLGGQETYFKTFRWALSAGGKIPIEQGLEHPELPDGTGEFLDAWLLLLEKMVNPKAILDTPHVISNKGNARGIKNCPFDPVKYLIQIHKLAFDAVKLMWGKKPLSSYGSRMSESMLSIIRHILRGEKIIKERLSKSDDAMDTRDQEGEDFPSLAIYSEIMTNFDLLINMPDVNYEHLYQLLDMGFPFDLCREALMNTNTMEQATDYLLNSPRLDRDPVTNAPVGETSNPNACSRSKKAKEEECTPLSERAIEEFIADALPTCLKLLDTLPETVYRVCDLLVTITKRNGDLFRDRLFDVLLTEIRQNIALMFETEEESEADDIFNIMIHSESAAKISVRLHLFTLLFEGPAFQDMRIPCAHAVHRSEILPALIKLLEEGEHYLQLARDQEISTPRWLTPLLLLLDLVEKVAVCTQRKDLMHKVTKPLWMWYDLSTSKWSPYTTANQKIINDAYWNGESSVRVTCGRRRYTLTFATMGQVNDESGNHRPISMSFRNPSDTQEDETSTATPMTTTTEEQAMEFDDQDQEQEQEQPSTSAGTTSNNSGSILSSGPCLVPNIKADKRNIGVKGLTEEMSVTIVRTCVNLMKLSIERDALHAVMRICLRLTRDFRCARIFAQQGGVKLLLEMTQASAFTGFVTLATLLIRHVLEEPQSLCLAVEKVIRGRALMTIPPSHKEILYLFRQVSSAVCRNPEVFYEVAKSILRIDTSALHRRSGEEEDRRLLLRCEPPTRSPAQPMEEEVSVQVIYDLLLTLIKPPIVSTESATNSSPDKASPSSSNSKCGHRRMNESIRNPNDPVTIDLVVEEFNLNSNKVKDSLVSFSSNKNPLSDDDKKPLMPKNMILKLLAEAVRSYGSVAKLITEFCYKSGQSELITEDCSALAFLLDKLLPVNENSPDAECSMMVRMLVAAIASCNHSPEAQSVLVTEIKSALCRALVMAESNEKHSQIQLLTGLVSTMIENCPPGQSTPFRGVRVQSTTHLNPNAVNNIVKIMLRKGLLQDLARIPHCLDLSSPNMAATINAAMKPLETLSRIVNQPVNVNYQPKFIKPKTNRNNQSGTTSTEATNAQGEETVEDAENTEHDISATAESLEPHSEGQPQEEGEVAGLEDIMDQLLDRDNQSNSRTYSDVASGRNIHTMDVDEEATEMRNLVYETERDVTVEELMTTDSGESDSNASDQEVEDEENDEDEVDDEDIDEEGEENEDNNYEENEDNNTGLGFFDNENPSIFRIAPERDEEVLMIQYSDPDAESDSVSRMVHWNPSNGFQLPFGMFEDIASNNEIAAPSSHPLLMSRHNVEMNTMSVSRTQRTNRQRRYQYLQINPRNQNPPVILQSAAREYSEMNADDDNGDGGGDGDGDGDGDDGDGDNDDDDGDDDDDDGSDDSDIRELDEHVDSLIDQLLGPASQNIPITGPVIAEPSLRVSNRVVVMENGFGIFPNSEEQIDFVDQSGYLFGPSLAATLNHVPSALFWWNEECKLLDGDSEADCCVNVAHRLVPTLEQHRDAELNEKKRKRQEDEEFEYKNSMTKNGNESMETENKINEVQNGTRSDSSIENDSTPDTAQLLAESIVDSVLRPNSSPSGDMGNRNVPDTAQILAESIVDSVLRPTEMRPHRGFGDGDNLFRTPRDSVLNQTIFSDADYEERLLMSPTLPVSRTYIDQTEYESRNDSSPSRQPVGRNASEQSFAGSSNTANRVYPQPVNFIQNGHVWEFADTLATGNSAATASTSNQPLLPSSPSTQDTRSDQCEEYMLRLNSSGLPSFERRSQDLASSEEPPMFTIVNVRGNITDDDDDLSSSNPAPSNQDDENITDTERVQQIAETVANRTTDYNSADSPGSMDLLVPIRERPYDPYESHTSHETDTDRGSNTDEILACRLEDNEIIEILNNSQQIPTPTPRRISNLLVDDDMPIDGNGDTRNRRNLGRVSSADEISTESDNGTSESQSQSDATPRMSLMSTPLVVSEGPIIGIPSEIFSGMDDDRQGVSLETASAPPSQASSPPLPQPFHIATRPAPSSLEASATNSDSTQPSSDPLLDIPEGVDPSFLEALPDDVRREVIAEQRRLVRLQQRAQANTSNGDAAASGSSEVSPEFLAALPPALQEEVLAQQRLEQQRQAAATANPDDPVDAAAFFQNLQPSLRQAILTDIEESQISVLPPDLAAEAQNLRRDWEARNRQMMQERFLNQLQSTTALSSILRHGNRAGRLGARYAIHTVPQRCNWNSWNRGDVNGPGSASASGMKLRGRQLLDHESLSCLLVLLFADEPKLNTLRLHRVIRNLCYHAPTRDWIVRALLSIIDRSVNMKSDTEVQTVSKSSKRAYKPGPLCAKLTTDPRSQNNNAAWLNIKMDAALGCRANVFIVHRNQSGKRTDRQNTSSVTVHPQAAPVVCRHALDLFISLAKSFPTFFLPLKKLDKDEKEKDKEKDDSKKDSSPDYKNGKFAYTSPSKKNQNQTVEQPQTDFWDMLLKLDSLSATKKGKNITKAHNNSNTSVESDNASSTFETSTFGQLLSILSSPVITRSSQLTDKLLRLLSLITLGLPEVPTYLPSGKNVKCKGTKLESVSAFEESLRLVINVITAKNCSEEGLEDAATLLFNVANCSDEMRFMVLWLMMQGALTLAEEVTRQIRNLLEELKSTNRLQKTGSSEEGPSTDRTSRGLLCDRFTKEAVVVIASSKVKQSCDLQLPSMAPLTTKTSSQAFFLRLLRLIAQIHETVKKAAKQDLDRNQDLENVVIKDKEKAAILADPTVMADREVPNLSEMMNLGLLWNTLSQCLLELEHTPDHHAVLVLQPTVEAFFLVHSPSKTLNETNNTETEEQTEPPEDPLSHLSQPSNEIPKNSTNIPVDQQKFLQFAEKHRTVLNQILRQTSAHLADGPFSVLVDHTRILDFDVKRKYFRTELERLDNGIRREETAVHIRRSHIFEDSFRELYRRPPEEWKNRFYIVFEDEEGQDAGGLLREWYMIISRDIFNPMYALFTVSPGDRVTYMINSSSHCNPNHLCYYKFVGRVIAKAIYDNKLLECYFTRSFYKHILGIQVKHTDMESEDYSLYKGLKYLTENRVEDVGYELTFSAEVNEFGSTQIRDLVPNGQNILVTEENKMEYIRLLCQMKMTGAIKQQLKAFLEGFYDIIPKRLISIFNEQELELLISGLPNVDIEDLKSNTEYHKYQSNSLQIQWFWRALRSFDQAERAKFLQFVTGTSKVPLQGFAALEGMNGTQKFQIHRDDRSTDRLPSAHTCFNQLDLPVYETYDKLRSYLLKAIHECSEGFGFA